MLIGGAAARRQLVARGVGNHVAAVARNIRALRAPTSRHPSLRLRNAAVGDDAIFSRVGINTGYSAAAGDAEILQ
jgi:uncharacterized protein YbjT (DUF2867 family)